MVKRIKGLYNVDTVIVNEYDKDKNVIIGEWYHRIVSIAGMPILSRTVRRDTNQYINQGKKQTIGFNK